MSKQEQNTKMTIGVTGGIGSGKTAVTDFFASKSVTIVDADLAARVVVEPGKPALEAIAKRFGSGIILNGNLDRGQLRTIIFDSVDERLWLEALLHPLIRDQIRLELQQAKSPYAILVSPLMLETDQHELVNRILVVDLPEATQIERAMNRDHMDEDQTRKIIASQMPREKRLEWADDVVENSGTLEQLHQSLEKLHETYLSLV
ncbi:dephospho-CoA kinase [uncultured Endozoicomonas sp.]|uniref:dephospho-CoA kinase n=1 Tax=uncultured Endozoicomonas sp. TaxID=432652 RepID=UPI00262E9A51|nr:dephospho-CoA kinase [uncultured Endozoicomonas sp.]